MMAQPSVRAKAMGDKDQAEVWAEVKKQQQSVAVEVAAGPTASIASTQEIQSTSSYARVMENKDVKEKVDEIAAPIQQSYESLIKQLRDRRAVGVVVAVNGRIIWADVFASTELLERYWPKLVRSYASEAVVVRAKGMEVSSAQAEAFLADVEGRRETIEIEPGVYRHAEASGDGFKAFALTSLLPKTGFDLHIAKMAE
jgi:sulfur carrier protein ThiS